jgi:hypothetical protein
LLKGGVKTLVTKPLLYIIMNLCLKFFVFRWYGLFRGEDKNVKS